MRVIAVLADRGTLAAGTPLEILPELLPADAPSRDPRAFRARVGDPKSPRRPLIWDLDGQHYSPTELTCRLWREYDVHPIGTSYYSHWRIVGANWSLWDEAKQSS